VAAAAATGTVGDCPRTVAYVGAAIPRVMCTPCGTFGALPKQPPPEDPSMILFFSSSSA
jgi:hypothetical protein